MKTFKLVVSASAWLAACSAFAGNQVTLKVSHFLPATSTFQKGVIEPWCQALAKDSNDRLKCQIYPALQLGGTVKQLIDQAKDGVADVIWTSPSFSTGRFPITEALELPFTLPPGALDGSRAMWDYYEKNAKAEYADFHVLAIFSASNVVISMKDKPILDIGGFKGAKVRSPSRFSAGLLTTLGATPVSMPISQITESVSKGVVDGAMAPWEIIPAAKIDEVTKYHMEGTSNQPGFTQTPMAILMNAKAYERLPDDLKAIVDRHSGKPLSEAAGKAWDTANDAARQKVAAEGNRIVQVKPEDYTAMKRAASAVELNWIKQANLKGLNGVSLAADVHALGMKYMPR